MSDKDNIREMVYALARGDQAAVDEARKKVFASKTKRITEAVLNAVDNDEGEEELEEGHGHNPHRRHVRAGGRHMRRNRDMTRDMVAREARRDFGDDDEGVRVRGKKRRIDRSMRRRRPRRSDMYEANDTGSDSSVMKGKYDEEIHDTTQKKGKVKDSKNIDHEDYTGDKPNAYKDKGKSAGK